MPKRYRRVGCLAALFLVSLVVVSLVPAPILATASTGEPEVAIAGRFINLSIADGLPNPRVFAIDQDQAGFLWIATQNGLARFDGHEFEVFRHDPDDPTSLPDNYVTTIRATADGAVWIGTVTGRVARLDPHTERFEVRSLNGPPGCIGHSHQILGLEPLDDGGVLVVGDFGLIDLPVDGPSRHRTPEIDNCEAGLSGIVRLGDAFWFSSTDGLLRWQQGQDRLERIGDLPPLVTLCRDHDRGLVLAPNDGGLLGFTPGTGRLERHPIAESIGSKTIGGCLTDRDGTMWLAPYALISPNNRGLLEVPPPYEQSVLHKPDAILPGQPAEATHLALFQDRSGVLWFGGLSHGLDRLDPRRRGVERHLHNAQLPSLPMDHVLSIGGTADGETWVGFFGAGVQRLDRDRRPVETLAPGDSGLRSGHIWDLVVDDDGRLWVAHEEGVDLRLGDRFVPVVGFEGRGLVFLESSTGRLWAGGATAFGHIDRSHPEAPRFVEWPQLDSSPTALLALAESDDGHLWLGFDGAGISRLDPVAGLVDSWDSTALGHGVVVSIHIADDGFVWAGTLGAGLVRIDPTTGGIDRIGPEEGLSSTAIKAILPGSDGALWLSTDHGIDRFVPATGAIRRFDIQDGIPANGFVSKAGYAAGDRLWFGSIEGLINFRPDDLSADILPPAASLTWLEIVYHRVGLGPTDPDSPLDRPLHRTDSLSLSHRDRVVSIGFTAFDFGAPERHRFRYRLDGFDDAWVETSADERFARYSSLPAGDFTFRVEASFDGEHWGAPAVLGIHVRPPWWRSAWALAVYAALLVGGIGTVFERQRRQVKTLGGLLPICASCKKIRDDDGYWEEVEAYVTRHSRAHFSHGLCPPCFDRSIRDLEATDLDV